jgi:hypothetical protein
VKLHARFGQMERRGTEGACAKDNVFQNGEALRQRKVLMHHPDARLQRSLG